MSRVIAREYAFKLLFQNEFNKEEDLDSQIDVFLENIDEEEDQQIKNIDKYIQFIHEEVKGTISKVEEVDKIISTATQGWKLNRMSKVDLSILRLAVYEITYVEEIPTNVSINEAINLAKKYSGGSASSFINGVLGKIVN